ncbi:MAG TPA: hypothetical protein VKK31_05655 [Thermoanaerobaculia bacterium]|nr:hypothetical protein [Thermoanaerobaculia bacterium]
MPSDLQLRDQRLEAIKKLIHEPTVIRSQLELQRLLREKGFQTTQSSLSRDLKELGIQRINGRYVSASPKDRGDGGFMNWGVFLEVRAVPPPEALASSTNLPTSCPTFCSLPQDRQRARHHLHRHRLPRFEGPLGHVAHGAIVLS